MILVLQVAVDNELVNSSSPLHTTATTYEWPAIEWACRPLLLGAGLDIDSVNMNINGRSTSYSVDDDAGRARNSGKYTIDDELYILQEKTRELCLKIRGGRLGGDKDKHGSEQSTMTTTNAVVDRSDSDLASNETDIVRTTIIEKSGGVLEGDSDNETISTFSLSAEEEIIVEDYNDTTTTTTTTTISNEVATAGTIELSGSSELPSAPPAKKQKVSAALKTPPRDVLDAYTFSFYQENDGSESDPDRIPRKYIKMQHGNRDAAKQAMEATLEWRKQHDIDTILARAHPEFDVCKKVFPHYFCGRDESKHVVLLQRPGLIDIPMARANSLTGETLLFHYVYEMEYLWKIIEPDPDATMTSVIDLTGLNISVLRKPELINVAKLFVSTMDAHFPLRSHRTLLINSPKWFGAIYTIISPLLRESTKQKITILSKGKKQDEALQNILGNCPIPTGKNRFDEIPPSEMEIDLRNFVSSKSGCCEQVLGRISLVV